MKIGNQDKRRLQLLLTLCENLDDLKKRLYWARETPSLDDSPNENLSEFLQVIGIVSGWLSPEFKEETRGQMLWGCLAMLRRDYLLPGDDRGSEIDYEIATTDIHTLIDLCKWWLETESTEPKPFNKADSGIGGLILGSQNQP